MSRGRRIRSCAVTMSTAYRVAGVMFVCNGIGELIAFIERSFRDLIQDF